MMSSIFGLIERICSIDSKKPPASMQTAIGVTTSAMHMMLA